MEQKGINGIKGFFRRFWGHGSGVANDAATAEKPLNEASLEKRAVSAISEGGWALLREITEYADDFKAFLNEDHSPGMENRFIRIGHRLTWCLEKDDAQGARQSAFQILDEYADELHRELEEKKAPFWNFDERRQERHKADIYGRLSTDSFLRVLDGVRRADEARRMSDPDQAGELAAADEVQRLAALDLKPDYIDVSLDLIEKEFGSQYLQELFGHSPHREAQMDAVERGDLEADERLSAETSGWAVDALIYKTRPAVYGLLSAAAKDCLRNDLMMPAPLVNIFDNSREGYTQAAENFNRAVETGSPADILCSFHSLFLHAESYEFEKMDRKGLSFDKASEKLAGRYGEDFGSGFAEYKKQAAKLAAAAHSNMPELPRKAPMLSGQPDIPSVKIREAPMLSQVDAAPGQPGSSPGQSRGDILGL